VPVQVQHREPNSASLALDLKKKNPGRGRAKSSPGKPTSFRRGSVQGSPSAWARLRNAETHNPRLIYLLDLPVRPDGPVARAAGPRRQTSPRPAATRFPRPLVKPPARSRCRLQTGWRRFADVAVCSSYLRNSNGKDKAHIWTRYSRARSYGGDAPQPRSAVDPRGAISGERRARPPRQAPASASSKEHFLEHFVASVPEWAVEEFSRREARRKRRCAVPFLTGRIFLREGGDWIACARPATSRSTLRHPAKRT